MAPKKKILYLITKSNFGGAQKYVYDLATTLPTDQFEVVVALGGTGEKGAEAGIFGQMLADAKIQTIFLPHLTRDIFWLSEIFGFIDILKILHQEKPEVLHLNSSKAAGIGAFWGRLLGIKNIIYTVHGWPFNESKNWLTKNVRYFFSWLTCFFSHRVIVISQQNLLQGEKMWGQKKKMHLIYNGLKKEKEKNKDEARESLGKICQTTFDSTEIIGGTIAELHPNKNLEILVQAIGLTKNNFKYIIIGEGEARTNLEKKIVDLDLGARVFLAGFVPKAATYLPAFDFLVLPSIKEGHPYTLLEAGLAHLPAIGSDIPGIRDILAETGNPLFPASDVAKLAEYLDGLASNEEIRQALGAKLHDYVTTNFSFEKMISQTISLY